MLRLLMLAAVLSGGLVANSDFDQTQAARFAALALDCVHKPYPNKIAHSLNSDADVKRHASPHRPSVHGNWLLVRLARLFPQAPFAADAHRRPLTELAAKLKAIGLESIKSEYYEGGHFSRTLPKPGVQLMGRWTGA